MIKINDTVSSFSVKNLEDTKKFYTDILECKVEDKGMVLKISLPGETQLWAYPKDNHVPASFTVLNLMVDNIDETVDELVKRGVKFERYENGPKADEKGIVRGASVNMGPNIAWFTDPSGNIISVIEEVK